MTKIDLARVNAKIFELHTDFMMSSEVFDQLFGEYSERFDEDDPILFLDIYSRQSTKHMNLCFISKLEEEQKYHLHLHYRIDASAPTPPKWMWKPDDAFEKLQSIVGVSSLNAQIRFIYPADRFYSSMRLPIALGPDTMSETDQIWGLRLIRFTNDGKVKFNIIIDQDTEEILHNLEFEYAGRLATETIIGAFNAGVNISEKFVNKLRVDISEM
jgi:hypothetical protein